MDSRLLIGNRQKQENIGGTGIKLEEQGFPLTGDHLVMKPFTTVCIRNKSIIIKQFRGPPTRIWKWNRKSYSKLSSVFWTESESNEVISFFCCN